MSDTSLFLQAGDFVGVSFWIVSVAMVAATVFFFDELEELQLTNRKLKAINSENTCLFDIINLLLMYQEI